MAITNTASDRGKHIDDLRAAIEHRATWFYLLVQEAKERGLGYEFAREAVRKTGNFHGETRLTPTDDFYKFSSDFLTENVRNIFEMEVNPSDDELNVTFGYCPLVSAWQKLGANEEEMAVLCDIAMDGDRGITEKFPGFEFHLGKTIAQGASSCQLRFTRKEG